MMDESRAPVVRKEEQIAVVVAEQSEKMTLDVFAEAFMRSGYFKNTESMAQAIVKIQAGRELGIPPFASMKGIHVVKEKLEFDGALLRALIRRGDLYDYRIDALDNTKAVMTLINKHTGETVGTTSFTVEDAKAADLMGKDIYQKYPRNMLLNRCTSNLVKFYCPDVTIGPAYTLGELAEGFNMENVGRNVRPIVRPAWVTPFLQKLRPFVEPVHVVGLRTAYADRDTSDEQFINMMTLVWETGVEGKPPLPPECGYVRQIIEDTPDEDS